MFEKTLMRELMKRGADDVVITTSMSERSHLKFVNNQIIAPMLWQQEQSDVFFVYQKRPVLTTLQHLTKAGVPKVASSLLSFAKRMPPKDDYMGIADGPFNYKPIEDTYDKGVLSLDKAPEMVESSIQEALQAGASRVSGVFDYGLSKRSVITSGGADASAQQTSLYFSVRAIADKSASGHQVCAGCMLKGFSPEDAGREAGNIAKLAKEPKKYAPGKVDVVFEPLAFANFLDLVGASASMFMVEAGISFLGDKQGQELAAKSFNLVDDGRYPNGFHSSPFDHEGVPTKRTPIFQAGRFNSYLYNTSLARKHKVKTTANAGLIAPEPWNIVMEKGKYNKDRLLAEVGDGLLITNLWYTRFQNYLTGQFSTVPRDGVFVIKKGEVHHPVRGIRVSDSLLRMLKSIIAAQDRSVQVLSWETEHPVITPAVAIKDVNITGSTS